MPPAENIVQAKPANIFKRQWPDIIFAKSLNARLITLKLYDTTSIAINNGARAIGAPEGKNKDNIWKPWVLMPMTLIPTKAMVANANVTAIWLVTVKL